MKHFEHKSHFQNEQLSVGQYAELAWKNMKAICLGILFYYYIYYYFWLHAKLPIVWFPIEMTGIHP